LAAKRLPQILAGHGIGKTPAARHRSANCSARSPCIEDWYWVLYGTSTKRRHPLTVSRLRTATGRQSLGQANACPSTVGPKPEDMSNRHGYLAPRLLAQFDYAKVDPRVSYVQRHEPQPSRVHDASVPGAPWLELFPPPFVLRKTAQ
jgi:hypothetical protein